MNYREIIIQYRQTYKRFLKHEGKAWNAEANMIELYKQIGELFTTYLEKNETQFADELLDVMCQHIRLLDFYKYNAERVFERLDTLKNTEKLETIESYMFLLIKNTGLLSKYIMTIEKYYFKTCVNDPRYKISDDILINCILKNINYVIEMATLKNIDLMSVSNKSRQEDQVYFKKIEKEES